MYVFTKLHNDMDIVLKHIMNEFIFSYLFLCYSEKLYHIAHFSTFVWQTDKIWEMNEYIKEHRDYVPGGIYINVCNNDVGNIHNYYIPDITDVFSFP
jgi:hypothetical protein